MYLGFLRSVQPRLMADGVVSVGRYDDPATLSVSADGLTADQQAFLDQFIQTPAEPAADDTQNAQATPPVETQTEAEPPVNQPPTPEYEPIAPAPEHEEAELPPEVAADKKAAHAFGQLRTQNAEMKQQLDNYTSMMDEFVGMFGLDKSLDEKKKADALKQAILAYKSQKEGIPMEALQQLSQHEQRIRQFEVKELEYYNIDAFNKLQKEFHLTDTEVEEFKQELITNGVDWQHKMTKVDSAYRDWHHKDIVDREVQLRLQAEQQRKTNVQQHATTPPASSTPTDVPDLAGAENEGTITSMYAFNDFLRKSGMVGKE